MSADGHWGAHELNYGPPGYVAVHTGRSGFSTFLGGWNGISSSDVARGGVVAIAGTPFGGTRGVYTFGGAGAGGKVAGSEALPSGTVALNDVGDVALLEGTSRGAGTRLWLLRNGQTETILSAGDALLSSTVSTIGFDPKGFNNAEQFALLVGLTDGREVFVLASPVPEPAEMGVVAGAALVLMRRRRGT
jgi:hypothetical protein